EDEDHLDDEVDRELGVAGDRHPRDVPAHRRVRTVASAAGAGIGAAGSARVSRGRGHLPLPPLSGRQGRDVDYFELKAIRVVEEDRVVAGDVVVLLRAALDLGAPGAEPLGPLVDDAARVRLEGEVVETDRVAVVRRALRLRLPQPDRGAGPAEVPDRLAPLALDLADPVKAERREQVAVEGQAALDRR